MPPRDRRHLLVEGTATAEPYRTPRAGGGGGAARPPRDRASHGRRIKTLLERARAESERRLELRSSVAVSEPIGTHLEFMGEPGFSLKIDSLEDRQAGIELTAVRRQDDVEYATVFVPHGKIGRFLRKVEAYLDRESPFGRPRNAALIESIAEVRLAVLESFWTDAAELFPDPGVRCWWEVWLRHVEGAVDRFVAIASESGLDVDTARLEFPEAIVLLAAGTREQLSAHIDLLDVLAELRLAKSAALYLDRSHSDQREAVTHLLERATLADDQAPAACVLDTGVDRGHPLLAGSLAEEDVHACDPAWGTADHYPLPGHGTAMAGLALFGDLGVALQGSGAVHLEHRVESVKILPSTGRNDPKLYGQLTQEGAARAETRAPQRPRVFCCAVTAPDGRDLGRPSSWSAAIDDLCAGTRDDERRLVVLSAGNVGLEGFAEYPARIQVESVRDPGQSWNAVTVGAYTDRVVIHEPDFSDWTPLAGVGELSPSTTTSLTWDEKRWPIKPDLVMEGGNAARSPGGTSVDLPDSLSVLSCSRPVGGRLLTAFGDTSAAAALASRMAATLMARYPELWPETIRALLVHSAEWTPAMLERYGDPRTSRESAELLLRQCGYGAPNLEVAASSAANDLTLLIQDHVQPFDDGSMNEMNVHRLPWPREELQALGDTPVEMRVTLSYFIEPSPGERGWDYKHRYASYGLRFEVSTPWDSLEEFRARVNAAARSGGSGWGAADASRWTLGPTLRSRGSIHHDRWHGRAAHLATREYVAIAPVMGWWRDRRHLGRSERTARYSLVVTIRAPDVDVDLYNIVASKIGVPVTVTT